MAIRLAVRKRHFLGQIGRALFALLVLGLIVALLSVSLRSSSGDTTGTRWHFIWTCFAISLLTLVIAPAFGWLLSRATPRRHLSVFRDRRTKRHVGVSIAVALVVSLIALLIQDCLETPNGTAWRFAAGFGRIFKDPGGLFFFLTGILSVAGVWFAVYQMAEFRQTITTFEELHSRLCELIQEVNESSSDDDYVRYLAYTPLTGCLALPRGQTSRLQALITNAIMRSDQAVMPKVSIVCLTEDDHAFWLRFYIERETNRGVRIGATEVKRAIDDTEEMLKKLEAWRLPPHLRPVRLRYSQMPGYYCFSSNSRAIIVAPIFLPLPPGAPQDRLSEKSVQMLGFETLEPAIVESLNKLHNLYRDTVSQSVDIAVRREGEPKDILPALEAELRNLSGEVEKKFEGKKLVARLLIAENAPVLNGDAPKSSS